MYSRRPISWVTCLFLASSLGMLHGQQNGPANPPAESKFMAVLTNAIPPKTETIPLYEGAPIPNSKPTPDQESTGNFGSVTNVTRPTIQVYLPAKAKATGASILVFPGGGYSGVSMTMEGAAMAEFLQDHGIAAFIVKYRLPSDLTMADKSIGPLQDAQQALLLVRKHAKEWNLDPSRVGAMGFSAGGHLVSTLATHFNKAYVNNPDGISLRPDFTILVYPVISMDPRITHFGSRTALLGPNPTDEQVKLFSNELQVTNDTPPALILQAADDHLVDVDNSIAYFEALHHHDVPVDMRIFRKGDHGFFLLARDEWESLIPNWMEGNGWLK